MSVLQPVFDINHNITIGIVSILFYFILSYRLYVLKFETLFDHHPVIPNQTAAALMLKSEPALMLKSGITLKRPLEIWAK